MTEISDRFVGAGESGKSTIAKQMRIIHKLDFNDAERERFKSIIHENILATAKALILAQQKFKKKPGTIQPNQAQNTKTKVYYLNEVHF